MISLSHGWFNNFTGAFMTSTTLKRDLAAITDKIEKMEEIQQSTDISAEVAEATIEELLAKIKKEMAAFLLKEHREKKEELLLRTERANALIEQVRQKLLHGEAPTNDKFAYEHSDLLKIFLYNLTCDRTEVIPGLYVNRVVLPSNLQLSDEHRNAIAAHIHTVHASLSEDEKSNILIVAPPTDSQATHAIQPATGRLSDQNMFAAHPARTEKQAQALATTSNWTEATYHQFKRAGYSEIMHFEPYASASFATKSQHHLHDFLHRLASHVTHSAVVKSFFTLTHLDQLSHLFHHHQKHQAMPK